MTQSQKTVEIKLDKLKNLLDRLVAIGGSFLSGLKTMEIKKESVMLWITLILSFFGIGSVGDEMSNVSVAMNGDLLVAGSILIPDDGEDKLAIPQADTYIARLKSDGKTVKWEKSYGWNKDDHAYSIAEYTDGSLQVVGDTWSSGNGLSDAYFMCLDSMGELIWEQDFGGPSNDSMRALALFPDRFVSVGFTQSSGGWGEGLPWAMAVDKEGKFIWSTVVGQEHAGRFRDVVRTRGGVVAVGEVQISSDPEETDSAVTHVLVAKLSDQGEIVWQNQHLVGFSPEARAVVSLSDGGFLIGGSTHKSASAYRDGFILRLDQMGSMLGFKLMGGSKHDTFNDLILLPKNRWLAIGETRSFGVPSVDIWLRGGTLNGATFVNDHFGTYTYTESGSALALHPNGSIAYAANHYVGILAFIKP